MRVYLVTGSAGFIGNCFVKQLLDSKKDVVSIDKLSYAGNKANLEGYIDHPYHTFIEGSICDQGLMSQVLRDKRVTHVVNFAAESHVDRSIDDPGEFLQNNVIGTYTLLQESYKYWKDSGKGESHFEKFLQVSTDEVYGSCNEGKFTEQSRYEPNSPYSASKASADHFVRAYCETFEFPALITNCSNNYGSYQYPEKLIPTIIMRALNKLPLPVYGDGSNVRDWIHVSDHCNAVKTVLDKGVPGETYLVGASTEVSNLDIVKTICKVLDRLKPIEHPYHELITFVEDRPGHDQRYAIDATKIQTELGWKPTVKFEDGLYYTVKWYIRNMEWVDKVSHSQYRKRIGLKND
jgi:dTDP-glucose 4,6-dehydratase